MLHKSKTNTNPVRTRSNIIVLTQILIRVMTIFSLNASLFVFASKFYKNMNKSAKAEAQIVKAKFSSSDSNITRVEL